MVNCASVEVLLAFHYSSLDFFRALRVTHTQERRLFHLYSSCSGTSHVRFFKERSCTCLDKALHALSMKDIPWPLAASKVDGPTGANNATVQELSVNGTTIHYVTVGKVHNQFVVCGDFS